MTVLRRPAEWSLLGLLGDETEPEDDAFETTQRRASTSLLEQLELFERISKDDVGMVTRYILHPATTAFIAAAHPDDPDLLLRIHRRLGEHLEAEAKTSTLIEIHIETGHHLFEAGVHDRAHELLGGASDWLQSRGKVREGLKILEPFLDNSVRAQMTLTVEGQLLGTIGLALHRLREVDKAIDSCEQVLLIFREIGDRQREGAVLGNLGNAYLRLGDVEKAIGYLDLQLAIAREIGDRKGESSTLGNLGYLEQSREIGRAIKDPRIVEAAEAGLAQLSKMT